MPALTQDDYIMTLPTLSGEHKDAVRCIFDERVNRAKAHANQPYDQLNTFSEIADDAYQFWTDVKDLPEQREGIKEEFTKTVSRFFERVTRYADYHNDGALEETEKKLKSDLKAKLKARINELSQS